MYYPFYFLLIPIPMTGYLSFSTFINDVTICYFNVRIIYNRLSSLVILIHVVGYLILSRFINDVRLVLYLVLRLHGFLIKQLRFTSI